MVDYAEYKTPGRKFDPDYGPREGNMEDDRRALENTVMRSRDDDRSPAARAFHKVQQDLSDLETVLMELYQKLQPALSPEFHDKPRDPGPSEGSIGGSMVVEELQSFSRQIHDKIDSVQIVTKRLEL